jgi:NADPH:quinone reductase-like Zn-dependent oxidoreductase
MASGHRKEVKAKIVKFYEKGGPEVLKLEEVTLSPVAENDVRVRVHAIGLNRAESMYRKGAFLQGYTWPSRVGYEASGVVEAIGKNVAGFAPGDAVSVVPGSISMALYGTYGEVADMPANRLTRNPDWLLHTDAAAAWIQYVTAYVGIVEIANLKAGETLMINAPSSSVGIAAIQVAKIVGAKPVAITTSPEKSNVLLGLGAVAVFSPTDAELPKKIDDLSGGLGARVIFDAVGGPGAALLQSAASLGAVHVIYGSVSDKNTEMSAMTLYAKRMTVRGFQLFEATDNPSRRQAAIDFVFIGLKSGALKPVIAKTFPLAQIVESHRYLESNQQIGKVVVTV